MLALLPSAHTIFCMAWLVAGAVLIAYAVIAPFLRRSETVMRPSIAAVALIGVGAVIAGSGFLIDSEDVLTPSIVAFLLCASGLVLLFMRARSGPA